MKIFRTRKVVQCMSFGTVLELNLFLSKEREIEYIDVKPREYGLILIYKTKL